MSALVTLRSGFSSLMAAAALLLGGADAFFAPSRFSHSAVRTSVRMTESWPPPLDAVHVFDVSGGDPSFKLSLTQISDEKRAALLSLWKFQYDAAGEPYPVSNPSASSDAPCHIHEPMLAENFRKNPTMSFAAYMGDVPYLKENLGKHSLGDEHAVAFVRLEKSVSRLGEQTVMIIEAMLVSPTLSMAQRVNVHMAMANSIKCIGEANGMSVQAWSSFDA